MISQLSMEYSYLFVVSLMVLSCSGQIAFHTDANTNSYSVKAPGSQQSFTRYFGGQQGSLLNLQQAQPSQQQFQYAPAPQQLQQNAYYTQAQQQQQPQQLAQGSQQQPQYVNAQEYSNFIQQQQLLQQHQLQQQAQYYAASEEQQAAASQQTPAITGDQQQQQQVANLLGVAYSPSTQVSHVKFSNGGGLAYNF